jgi:NAD(P)-dependent dehydrogenase (short-subunit alcohol dehydrogenase family)
LKWNFEGKTILITGGSGLVGRQLISNFLELNCSRIWNFDLEDVGSETLRKDDRYSFASIDVSDLPRLRAAVEVISRSCESLDVLINCAALKGGTNLIGWESPFEDQSEEMWDRALRTNLTAPFVLIQEALPLLQCSDSGVIVNVGSIYGMVGPDWRLYDGTPMGNPAAYAVSKAGLSQLTRWLATSLGDTVRVNCVSPGGIYNAQDQQFVNRYVERVPLKRMASVSDISPVILFLASDGAKYITGQDIVVDGGYSVW